MTVVVGYVPTPEGRAALDQGMQEARLRQSRLVIVNVAHGGSYVDVHLASDDELADMEKRLKEANIDHEIRQKVHGHEPVDELLQAASEPDVELLVLGLRRRSAVGKLLMGSKAQHLLLEVECPVLAVKAPRN